MRSATKSLRGVVADMPAVNLPRDVPRELDNVKVKTDEPCEIVVFGATSSGKSLLLNTLLDINTLPSMPGKTTPCLVRLEYGDQWQLATRAPEQNEFADKLVDFSAGPEALEPYLIVSRRAANVPCPYEVVRIRLPCPLLKVPLESACCVDGC
jgi:hypothetical protein